MDVSAQPVDPLAQPTRARLFALLCELRRPASTEELAELMELHPNGVRLHLDRLRDHGLVERERDRRPRGRPRGRPRDMWHVSPDAAPGGGPPTAYQQLGPWLARAIAPAPATVREVESAGRAIGRELAPSAPEGAEASLHAALASMGFAPRREVGTPDRLTYRLGNCPYREAARANPEIVCGLHRGITRGLLDELEPASTLVSFVPHEPSHAGCVIELAGPIAEEALGAPPD